MNKKIIAVAITGIVIISLLIILSSQGEKIVRIDVSFSCNCKLYPPISICLAKNYYKVTYNSSLGLFKDTPYSNVYYIESDNLLASIAEKYLNLSYKVSIGKYALSPYLVLLGIHNFSWCFRCPSCTEVKQNVYITNFTNPSRNYLNWYVYADISFLYSIYLLENYNYSEAMHVFSVTMRDFWNGYGFVDEAFDGKYSSYKLALAVIAWKYIYSFNKTFAMEYFKCIKEIYNVSSHLQSAIGGYFTCYLVVNGTIVPKGNVNTETTSLFVIAFFMKPVTVVC
ncbi:hypothetical protein [Acidianus sp. HS-5]|uniref:hypothetical protein n=1 Tax=Acidianus sp. HS-5 TaxID=2886040 RepID=UPI001F2193B8|nr:hypothetical protein [Acidianus sp. HS-5]BDC17689.1 hypothetical protein HS5_05790 [Acidianus sp. HS-5]